MLVARVHKTRDRSIWHATAFIDRLVDGKWNETPIEIGLADQEFTNEESAVAAALRYARKYVDELEAMP
jgi:hypothetical protein